MRETGYINYLVKVNLINQYLYFLPVPVVPYRFIYLNDFLRYYFKGLDNRDLLIIYYNGGGSPLIIILLYLAVLRSGAQSIITDRDTRRSTNSGQYKGI